MGKNNYPSQFYPYAYTEEGKLLTLKQWERAGHVGRPFTHWHETKAKAYQQLIKLTEKACERAWVEYERWTARWMKLDY